MTEDKPEETPKEVERGQAPTRVFVAAHGAKEAMKKDVLGLLEKSGIQPVLMPPRMDSSTPIEQEFSEHTDINFAVITLSGDDFVYPKNGKPGNAKLRARQDIVFELGYLLGKFGRQNVFVLYCEQKSFLFPSTFHDAIYTSYDKMNEWQKALKKRLQVCGYNIKDNAL